MSAKHASQAGTVAESYLRKKLPARCAVNGRHGGAMYAKLDRLFLANFWERGVQLAKLSAAFGRRCYLLGGCVLAGASWPVTG